MNAQTKHSHKHIRSHSISTKGLKHRRHSESTVLRFQWPFHDGLCVCMCEQAKCFWMLSEKGCLSIESECRCLVIINKHCVGLDQTLFGILIYIICARVWVYECVCVCEEVIGLVWLDEVRSIVLSLPWLGHRTGDNDNGGEHCLLYTQLDQVWVMMIKIRSIDKYFHNSFVQNGRVYWMSQSVVLSI